MKETLINMANWRDEEILELFSVRADDKMTSADRFKTWQETQLCSK